MAEFKYSDPKQEPEVTPMKAANKDKKLTPEDVDMEVNKHKGQIALRKLYHESPRPIMVLYTAKTCGPCRSLKPIVNAVADEFGEKVSPENKYSSSFACLLKELIV